MRTATGLLLTVVLAGGRAAPAAAQDESSARLTAAARLQEAGNHREAIELLEQIREIDPRNERVIYGLALSLYAVKEYREAAHIGSTLLAETKGASPDLYVVVGSAYGQLHDSETSEAILRDGLASWPDNQALHIQHAVSLEGLGRVDEAIVEMTGCLKRSPYEASLWRAFGDAYATVGSPGRAFASYVRALTLEEDDARAKEIASSLWSVLFEGSARAPVPDPSEKAEAKGLALIAALRRDGAWTGKSDASFFAYALDTSLRLVSALHGKDTKDLFWGPFVMDYFDEVRSAGHMEALAYDIRRATGDPDVARWREQNSRRVAAFRDWSERWSVKYSEVADKKPAAAKE
jgi:tetratricopeptide (TPR) repeat protein